VKKMNFTKLAVLGLAAGSLMASQGALSASEKINNISGTVLAGGSCKNAQGQAGCHQASSASTGGNYAADTYQPNAVPTTPGTPNDPTRGTMTPGQTTQPSSQHSCGAPSRSYNYNN